MINIIWIIAMSKSKAYHRIASPSLYALGMIDKGLSSLAMRSPKRPDKRRHSRRANDYVVDATDLDDMNHETIIRGTGINISREGLGLKIDLDAPIGRLLSLIIYHQDRDSLCLGRITWKIKSDNEFHYGIHIKRWTYIDPPLEQAFISLEKKQTQPSRAAEPQVAGLETT